jgi:alcohol dehydrogenase
MVAVVQEASQIIAVDVSENALKKGRELGATHTVLAISDEQVRRDVRELTGGHGADVTIDAAGFSPTCENAVCCCTVGGRMIQVGLPLGESRPEIPMAMVAGRELELVGSHGFAASDLPDLLQLVATGRLDPALLIEREVDLAEGCRVIENMDRRSPLGITMITELSGESASRL